MVWCHEQGEAITIGRELAIPFQIIQVLSCRWQRVFDKGCDTVNVG